MGDLPLAMSDGLGAGLLSSPDPEESAIHNLDHGLGGGEHDTDHSCLATLKGAFTPPSGGRPLAALLWLISLPLNIAFSFTIIDCR